MGKRGPKPLPAGELAARGSNRAASRKRDGDVVLAPPPRPSWLERAGDPLNGLVNALWDELVEHLVKRKVLGPGDVCALALLVHALRDYIRAKQDVDNDGETVETMRGPVTNPMSRVRDKAFARSVLLLREFGMTPSARAAAAIVENLESKAKKDGPDKSRFFTPPA